MYFLKASNPIVLALIASVLASALVLMSFMMFEPAISHASTTSTFTVTQQITPEISFKTAATNVTMSPAIAGLTGGVSSGTTTAVVTTNNSIGYTMTIAFSTSTAMTRNGGGGVIANYTPAAPGIPDYTFGSKIYGQFGYNAYSTTNGTDIATAFKNTGAACNSGSTSTAGKCWLNGSTTAKQIVNRSTATLSSGATTSVAFKVLVPSNPNPSIPTGYYTATATLTIAVN